MKLNEYQAKAARTINPENSYLECQMHALHGMAGEVGEIHSIFQKHYQGHIIDDDDLKKEVGDLLWMIAEFCTSRGWTLEEVAEMNINKLLKRYPDGFSAERSVHREVEHE